MTILCIAFQKEQQFSSEKYTQLQKNRNKQETMKEDNGVTWAGNTFTIYF